MTKGNDIRRIKEEYINEIKFLLPDIRKAERQYLQGLSKNIDEYLNTGEHFDEMSSKEKFYLFFGNPNDIVHQYYSNMKTKDFCSYLKLGRLKKRILFTLLALILTISVLISIVLWQEHLSIMRSEIVTAENKIIEYEEVMP